MHIAQMIEKTQDKQVLVCNFNPHCRQKVNALLIQNKHTKLFYNQFYIHYLFPDIGSFL